MDMRAYLKAKQREAEEQEARRRRFWERIACGAAILLIYAEVYLAIL